MKRTVRDLPESDLRGRRVFVRVDYNVPLGEGGSLPDPGRIRASYPTLGLLADRGARSVLASHLGRPGGRPDPALSLRPVAEFLRDDLGRSVRFASPADSEEAVEASRRLEEGEILVVENTRFDPGERENEAGYAERLARLGELYVNDAFAASHRLHASTAGVAARLRPAVAGLLVGKEMDALRRLRESPESPFVLLLGGAKIGDKVGLLQAFLDRADEVLIGGAMANTLLAASGREMGASRVDEEAGAAARQVTEAAGSKLRLPRDLVVAPSPAADDPATVSADAVPQDAMALDIGERTRREFADVVSEAATVFWNGPMGLFERAPYRGGTDAVAEAVARASARGAFTVVGGGDSARALKEAGRAGDVSHLSTGGGAALEFLAEGRLPAVELLDDA